MLRKPIIAMNLSMRQNRHKDAIAYSKSLNNLLRNNNKSKTIVFPSMGTIEAISKNISKVISFGSQNIAPIQHGACSGEFSIESLIDLGGEYVELGHWERREFFKETEEQINAKLLLCQRNNIIPILCCGEVEEIDDFNVIKNQLKRQLFNELLGSEEEDIRKIIIAYTPKWAVGRTSASSAPHIHEMGKVIRSIISDFYSEETSVSISIIYGGSVSPENTKLIVNNDQIDGVLVGRFGSNPERLAKIVEIVEETKSF